MLDWILAVLASYLLSAWEWCSGVFPYVVVIGLSAVAIAVFVLWFLVIMSESKQKQDARVKAILERGQKLNAKPQGEPEIYSL